MNPRARAQSVSASEARANAERSGSAFLEFTDRNGTERVFVFEPGSQSASVGRRSTSDLALDWDDQVSRLHARFERVDDAWGLVDDGLSSNGTFINGERLDGTRRLRDGDILRFGATTVTFRASRQQPPEPLRREAPPAAPAVALSSTQRRVLIALSRQYLEGNAFATPAGDEEIADELVVSIDEVQGHLRVLYAKLGVETEPRDQARARLVEQAVSAGLISERDL